ncbi:hypothetical protein MESS4_690072 [Mesorhizobium sp. STM 4661]|nr:hypothetical protein MESS4_690072 [Mesorhizobium sp. STM 4661]
MQSRFGQHESQPRFDRRPGATQGTDRQACRRNKLKKGEVEVSVARYLRTPPRSANP